MMKKVVRAIVMLMVTLIMTVGFQTSVRAEEALTETQFRQFMTALQPVDAKAEPDDNAETAFSYDTGASVYVMGETANGWYVVYYQGMTGYINKNTSQEALVIEEIDFEALDEELEALQVRDKILIEEIERYRAEVRRSRIWGSVIVLLVIGIFAVGIVSTVRAEKKKKEDEEPSKDHEGNKNNARKGPSKDHEGNKNNTKREPSKDNVRSKSSTKVVPQKDTNVQRLKKDTIRDLDKE